MKRFSAIVLLLVLCIALLPIATQAAEVTASGTCGENLTWVYYQTSKTLYITGTGKMDDYVIPVDYQPWHDYVTEIENAIISAGVTNIGSDAFASCSNLKSVAIPGSVTEISMAAFQGCQSLQQIVLPEGITTIDDQAFSNCSNLESISLPSSLSSIGLYAFNACTKLQKVYIADLAAWCSISFVNNPLQWHADLYLNGELVNDLIIPDGVTAVSYCAFDGCNSLTSVTFPDDVTSIGGLAFSECYNLSEIYFNGDAPKIEDGAFYNVVLTAYYPVANATWTADIMQDYQGDINWKPYGDHVHSYSGVTTAPTCTTDGYTVYTCSCGESYTGNTVPAYGHSETTVGGKAATCTTDGLTDGKKCSTCGTMLKAQETIPAKGHSFQNGTCSVCGAADPNYTKPAVTGILRIYGDNRYKTGFAVADQLKKTLGVSKFNTIVVACGTNFADALAGSYLAAQKNAPILLVNKHTVNDVRNYIAANLTSRGTVYLLGGTAAVPADMASGLGEFNVVRLAGENRYETNLAILKEAGTSGQEILVCTGKGFADSLSASAVNKPILLVNKSLTSAQKAFLKNSSGKFIIIGGESAVSKALEKELSAYGSVERVGGANRYETSVKVAERFFQKPSAAVLAYAKNFPDGLCGGPLAYSLNAPLILTATKVEAAAAAYTKANGIKNGIVLGGEGLISNDAAVKIFG